MKVISLPLTPEGWPKFWLCGCGSTLELAREDFSYSRPDEWLAVCPICKRYVFLDNQGKKSKSRV